ncbi:MAG: nucleotidyl transferase AbiEii/AbiGii toxin family protein [Victivallales bacterium]|nr:nucleotidyl transferase AbiEii/AbiGii toxin family protein [Victivallales bacterium]MBQ6473671.1 nucleotidyl transferase AbiEii/AbiGii toxin family protein [Victivallales bacterium]
MIYTNAIVEWKQKMQWQDTLQAEQDLLICRCLVTIFNDAYLSAQLAFRGGTALHKLHFQPQPRYSEDIDLVQVQAGPIKPILQRLGEVLSFLPDKVVKQKRYNNTLLFRVESEIPPVCQIRLKVEINCFEHFTELGYTCLPFAVDSQWFKGDCRLNTYQLEELLGTKLRALYQRRKGRDLFDLYYALTHATIDPDKVLTCYHRYISFVVGQPPSYRQFIANLDEKMQDADFLGDVSQILRPGIDFSPMEAYEAVREAFIERLSERRL